MHAGRRIIVLCYDHSKDRAGQFRQWCPIVIEYRGQIFDMHKPLRRGDAELHHMSPQRIDQHGALPDQQTASPMQHQHRLLFRILYRHKSHRRPCDDLTDRFSICRIILVSLDVSLHVGWRHKANFMSQRNQLTCPIMRSGAGFHADQAGFE